MHVWTKAAVALAIGGTLVCAPQGVGANAKVLAPIPLEEVLADQALAPHPSPDRSLLAFTVSEATRRQRTSGAWFLPSGLPSGFSGTRVRIVDVRTGRVQAVADDVGGKWASWAPSWSPDGKWLAFVSDRDGHPRIWRWERATGRVSRVSDAVVVDPTRRWVLEHWRFLQWTADGGRLLTRIVPEGMSLGDLAGYSTFASRPVEHAARESTATVYPRPESAAPGQAPVLMHRHAHFLGDLALVGVAGGGVTRLVRQAHAERYDLSPDGRHVALLDISTLRIVDTSGREVASDSSKVGTLPNTEVRWSPDGGFVWYVADDRLRRLSLAGAIDAPFGDRAVKAAPEWSAAAGAFLLADGKLILRLAAKGGSEVVATVTGVRFKDWLYSDEQRTAVFSRAGVAKAWFWAETDPFKPTRLAELDLATGRMTLLGSDAGTAHDAARLAAALMGRSVIYRFQDGRHYPNFWLAASDNAEARQLTHAGAVYERHELGDQRLVEWLTGDGERRRGVLVLPAGYQPGTRVPMIAWVYGGRASVAAQYQAFGVQGAHDNYQILATRGYAVFHPESKPREGTPMLDLAKDILPGISKVVEMGIADERRLGVMGHSYGGYTTLSLLVQTPRFRAAIAHGGLYNFVSLWGDQWDRGESAANNYIEFVPQARLHTTPWEAGERYIENSPFFYLDRVETPLLLIHGDIDPVPVLQADQVYFALRRLGKPVEYARYANAGHSMTDPANQLDLWRRRIEWFDRHLKASGAGESPQKASPSPRIEGLRR